MKALKKFQNDENQLELQRKIAQQLRTTYDYVLKDELPPNFKDLLRRLDERLH
jgi:Anti-sigma factor NepR